ncbi:MAG: ATP-dependent Clp protease ATP-binding subunit [Clostridia bacterium]|nr:ATP-dependent Clp protease ATP-binding subunit [Clostridia bacterium]
MVMCSNCHKRVAVIFVTKYENEKKVSKGLCIKCAKEMGIPMENMLGDLSGQLGLSPDQLENMEDELNNMFQNSQLPSEMDDNEDGGAPAIDLPKLFGEGEENADNAENLPVEQPQKKEKKGGKKEGKKEAGSNYKFLNTYCRHLTGHARQGRLDRIVGRQNELARVIQILCRRQKNNPCLIGEPGVGKTAIAEALALRIANGDVPYKLKNKELYQVDLTALVAGTQFRGQFEQRILGLLTEVKQAGNVILVIDEVHNIVGAGGGEGSINAANILKPALSRGEVQVIGATTLTEYRKHIEKDTALERRFQPVTVNEPSVEESVEMLRGIKHYYEEFHNITIPEDVLRRAVVFSERYITDRYLPDKAIDLLDEAASALSLSSAPLNESHEIRDRLLTLKQEREELEGAPADQEKNEQLRYEKIAKIKATEMQLAEKLATLEEDCKKVVLTPDQLAEVIEVWTGIPATTIKRNEYERIDSLKARLLEKIIGQDHAVEAVARAIKRNRAGISYKRKPVSFIFAGPTGVGKTELVKTLAEDLFQSPETLIRLDMSEFMEKHSVSRIIGSPPGYVGYDDAGQLTEKIRRRPYSVVLFDEIEKAHPDVLNILLQILDDGRITDAQGKTVNFENTVIIMTTNAGSNRSSSIMGFSADAQSGAQNNTEKALAEFLRPEFINRVDEVITFRHLDQNDFVRIANIMLGQLAGVLSERGFTLEWTQPAAALIASESYSQKYGARNMRRYIQKHVEDALAEVIVSDYQSQYTRATISVQEGKIKVSCS